MSADWMKQALALAYRAYRCDEVPVGCVIVHQKQCLSRAYNRMRAFNNPLAHAEVLCVLQAQKKLKSPFLEECSLYVTLEPCALCYALLCRVRLKKIYFAAYQSSFKKESPCYAMGGFSEREAEKLLEKFFIKKR